MELLNSTDVEELFSDCISFIMSSLNSVFVAETIFRCDGSRYLEITNSQGYPPLLMVSERKSRSMDCPSELNLKKRFDHVPSVLSEAIFDSVIHFRS